LDAPPSLALTSSGSQLTNIAGSSSAIELTLFVSDMPALSKGSFVGLIERSASINNSLGGRWEMTVQSNGTLTGKLIQGLQ